MPQFYAGHSGMEVANREGFVIFEIAGSNKLDTYNHDDNYFKPISRPIRIVMGASVAKFPRSHNGLSLHDVIFFNTHQGRNVELNIFGSLVPLKELTCQIKPYAIWQ